MTQMIRMLGLSGLFLMTGAIATELPDGKTFTNSIGITLARIEPGTFSMGTPDEPLPDGLTQPKEADGTDSIFVPQNGDFDERPVHQVALTKPFFMGTTEVTNQQYEEFDPLHAYLSGKHGFSIDHEEAAVFISWDEATAFCEWLSRKEGLPYRLPTEAEWEYSCRAGTTAPFSSGGALPQGCVKNPDNSWYPEPTRSRGREEVVPLHVGKTPANPWGLFDMHGNVEEWCGDWYGPYSSDSLSDPAGPEKGDFKVTRGGSHGTVAYYLRSSNRMGTLPEDKTFMIGFRVVIGSLPESKPSQTWPVPLSQQQVRQEIPANVTQGPDPTTPYFKGPRKYVHIPAGSEGPLFSRHNHDPGIAECPNGDLLAIWYSTVTERGRELGLAASRLRYGAEEWESASPFWDAPDRNDHAPALWHDGKRRLYFFVGLSNAATWGPLAIVMRTSDDSGASWSKALPVIPEHVGRHQPVESVIRTRDGAIILPCDSYPGGLGGTALHLSYDNGQTWTDPGGSIRGIHGGVVQLKDGRLMGLGRGQSIEDRMPKSLSSDMGKTWTYEPSIFPPIGGGQRLALLRLKEGPLFLASFTGEPLPVTDSSGKQRPVTGLFGAISYDEGVTWPKIRLISDDGPGREVEAMDGRKFTLSASSGEPNGYLSVCQGLDGVIHLISSQQHYAFNLKWLETPPPAVP